MHPDTINVVNIVRQRGELPLNADYKKNLNHRFLHPLKEFDSEEQILIQQFMTCFKPIYELLKEKYSKYYFTLLNGKKLSKGGYFLQ